MTRNDITKALEDLKNFEADLLHENWMAEKLNKVKDHMQTIRCTLDHLEKQIKEDLFKQL